MATVAQDDRSVSFEMLKRFGMKWAVLAALVTDLGKRGVHLPPDTNEQLKLTRMKIMSGCFSPCDVGCAFGKLEGQLISLGSALGEDYLRPWFGLLGQAMEGRIDPGPRANRQRMQVAGVSLRRDGHPPREITPRGRRCV
jgi:hypothetical protein